MCETGWSSRVHPVLRIVCFVILALFLALGNAHQLLLSALLVSLLFAAAGMASFSGLGKTLWRMRWFLLSIVVIYAWMTPGAPLFEAGRYADWLPSVPGLLAGGQRLLALVLIVAAVHWLLFVTPQPRLVSALYWLAWPLGLLGISRRRLAVRVALTLERVVEVQALVGRQVSRASLGRGDIRGYAALSAALVQEVVTRAEQAPCVAVEITLGERPPWWQWLWPVSLAGVLLAAGAAGG